MGNEIFGIDLAGIIGDVIGPGVFPVTVTRRIEGARNPANLTAGRAITTQTFECQGFWEDFTGTPPGLELELNDRKLILIGDTIPAGGYPLKDDAVVVHEPIGDAGPLYVIRRIGRDPAAAVYTFQCGDRRAGKTAG